MGSNGTIPLKDIWRMLDMCAPEHRKKKTDHCWRIWFGEHTTKLPLGEHGKRENPPTQIGHVRHLVRLFEIDECARGCLPQL